MQEYKSDKLDVAREPWITLQGTPVEEIVKQVQRCPSGALRYEILDKDK